MFRKSDFLNSPSPSPFLIFFRVDIQQQSGSWPWFAGKRELVPAGSGTVVVTILTNGGFPTDPNAKLGLNGMFKVWFSFFWTTLILLSFSFSWVLFSSHYSFSSFPSFSFPFTFTFSFPTNSALLLHFLLLLSILLFPLLLLLLLHFHLLLPYLLFCPSSSLSPS
jgi:hypothetical protein